MPVTAELIVLPLGRAFLAPVPPVTPTHLSTVPEEASLEVSAPDARILLEEAATALVRRIAPGQADAPACWWETVRLDGRDIADLAGRWLDRIIDVGAEQGKAVSSVFVDSVAEPDIAGLTTRWRLRGRIGLRPFGLEGPPVRTVRSASDRPLAIESTGRSLTLRARLAF
jgi:hypothetical protein